MSALLLLSVANISAGDIDILSTGLFYTESSSKKTKYPVILESDVRGIAGKLDQKTKYEFKNKHKLINDKGQITSNALNITFENGTIPAIDFTGSQNQPAVDLRNKFIALHSFAYGLGMGSIGSYDGRFVLVSRQSNGNQSLYDISKADGVWGLNLTAQVGENPLSLYDLFAVSTDSEKKVSDVIMFLNSTYSMDLLEASTKEEFDLTNLNIDISIADEKLLRFSADAAPGFAQRFGYSDVSIHDSYDEIRNKVVQELDLPEGSLSFKIGDQNLQSYEPYRIKRAINDAFFYSDSKADKAKSVKEAQEMINAVRWFVDKMNVLRKEKMDSKNTADGKETISKRVIEVTELCLRAFESRNFSTESYQSFFADLFSSGFINKAADKLYSQNLHNFLFLADSDRTFESFKTELLDVRLDTESDVQVFIGNYVTKGLESNSLISLIKELNNSYKNADGTNSVLGKFEYLYSDSDVSAKEYVSISLALKEATHFIEEIGKTYSDMLSYKGIKLSSYDVNAVVYPIRVVLHDKSSDLATLDGRVSGAIAKSRGVFLEKFAAAEAEIVKAYYSDLEFEGTKLSDVKDEQNNVLFNDLDINVSNYKAFSEVFTKLENLESEIVDYLGLSGNDARRDELLVHILSVTDQGKSLEEIGSKVDFIGDIINNNNNKRIYNTVNSGSDEALKDSFRSALFHSIMEKSDLSLEIFEKIAQLYAENPKVVDLLKADLEKIELENKDKAIGFKLTDMNTVYDLAVEYGKKIHEITQEYKLGQAEDLDNTVDAVLEMLLKDRESSTVGEILSSGYNTELLEAVFKSYLNEKINSSYFSEQNAKDAFVGRLNAITENIIKNSKDSNTIKLGMNALNDTLSESFDLFDRIYSVEKSHNVDSLGGDNLFSFYSLIEILEQASKIISNTFPDGSKSELSFEISKTLFAPLKALGVNGSEPGVILNIENRFLPLLESNSNDKEGILVYKLLFNVWDKDGVKDQLDSYEAIKDRLNSISTLSSILKNPEARVFGRYVNEFFGDENARLVNVGGSGDFANLVDGVKDYLIAYERFEGLGISAQSLFRFDSLVLKITKPGAAHGSNRMLIGTASDDNDLTKVSGVLSDFVEGFSKLSSDIKIIAESYLNNNLESGNTSSIVDVEGLKTLLDDALTVNIAKLFDSVEKSSKSSAFKKAFMVKVVDLEKGITHSEKNNDSILIKTTDYLTSIDELESSDNLVKDSDLFERYDEDSSDNNLTELKPIYDPKWTGDQKLHAVVRQTHAKYQDMDLTTNAFARAVTNGDKKEIELHVNLYDLKFSKGDINANRDIDKNKFYRINVPQSVCATYLKKNRDGIIIIDGAMFNEANFKTVLKRAFGEGQAQIHLSNDDSEISLERVEYKDESQKTFKYYLNVAKNADGNVSLRNLSSLKETERFEKFASYSNLPSGAESNNALDAFKKIEIIFNTVNREINDEHFIAQNNPS